MTYRALLEAGFFHGASQGHHPGRTGGLSIAAVVEEAIRDRSVRVTPKLGENEHRRFAFVLGICFDVLPELVSKPVSCSNARHMKRIGSKMRYLHVGSC